MSTLNNSENIFFVLNDVENNKFENEENSNNNLIQDLLDEFNINTVENFFYEKKHTGSGSGSDAVYSYKSFDDHNVSELLKICDYYGLLKYVKMAKYKKNEIIESIILFECDEHNNEIVKKRYRLWTCINELSKDKFMKKYIIWK